MLILYGQGCLISPRMANEQIARASREKFGEHFIQAAKTLLSKEDIQVVLALASKAEEPERQVKRQDVHAAAV